MADHGNLNRARYATSTSLPSRGLVRRTGMERTGETLPTAPMLAHHLPDARFVHICFDGRDTATSVSKLPGLVPMAFRSLASKKIGLDPFSPVNWQESCPWMRIPTGIMAHLIRPTWLKSREIPLESFGWL